MRRLILAALFACLPALAQSISSSNARALQGYAICGTTPTNGQLLTYSTADQCWEPGAGGGPSGSGTPNYLAGWVSSSALGSTGPWVTPVGLGVGFTDPATITAADPTATFTSASNTSSSINSQSSGGVPGYYECTTSGGTLASPTDSTNGAIPCLFQFLWYNTAAYHIADAWQITTHDVTQSDAYATFDSFLPMTIATGVNPSATALAVTGTSSFTGSMRIGTSPPSCTAGTGGVICLTEGTAPSAGLPGTGVDGIYADSTSHAFKVSLNNATALLMPLITGSITSGHAMCASGTLNLLADCGAAPGTGSVTSIATTAPLAGGTITTTGTISITGAAGQVLAGATPAFTATPDLGTDNSVAGTLQLANGSANAHTIWSSGATTTNTIKGFAAVPTTNHIVTCTVSSTTCTLTDGGALALHLAGTTFSGGGAALTTQVFCCIVAANAGTISAWDITVDDGSGGGTCGSCTATVKFWRAATGSATPTSSGSINTSGVSLSSGTAIHSTTTSDFTSTTIAANDIIAVQLSAVANAKVIYVDFQYQ